jgi:hypothetical protein
LEKIAKLFGGSKLIHLIRDPRDVAKSCIDMGWAGNTYFGADSWIRTERDWDAFSSRFDSDKILAIKYEDFISNPRSTLEAVCSFLGTRYSDTMLSYSNSSTYSGPDASLIEAWRRKLTAREIALIEVKTEPLLSDRGYEPSGYPLKSPGRIETFLLSWQDRFYRWRFMCRRYGLFDVAAERFTRRMFPYFRKNVVDRMNATTRRYLK